MGSFDKILKENIEQVILPLSKKLFNIDIKEAVNLPEKLQSTVEREPDYLKLITTATNEQVILHLEFQTKNEAKMVYRMAEYKAMLQKKFMLPVLQFVLYLGSGKASMNTKLLENQIISGFNLTSLNNLPAADYLASEVPEELILAILADYPKADTGKVIAAVLQKLQRVSANSAELKRSIQQLLTLSRLRKLEIETQKQLDAMPISYNIEKDGLYLAGKASMQAKLQQLEQEKEEGVRSTIVQLLKRQVFDAATIAEIAGVTVEQVEELKEKL